jgi:uncharacterized protein DUF3592
MAGVQPGARASRDSGLGCIAVCAVLAFLLGLGMLGAAYLAIATRRDVATAARADGTVIELIESRDADSQSFHPRVRFITAKGESVEFTSSVGSNPAGFDIGEHVTVLYDPSDPQGARIDSFVQLWFVPLFLGGFGLVLATAGGGVSIVFLRWSRKPPRPVAAPPPLDAVAPRPPPTVERAPRD